MLCCALRIIGPSTRQTSAIGSTLQDLSADLPEAGINKMCTPQSRLDNYLLYPIKSLNRAALGGPPQQPSDLIAFIPVDQPQLYLLLHFLQSSYAP